MSTITSLEQPAPPRARKHPHTAGLSRPPANQAAASGLAPGRVVDEALEARVGRIGAAMLPLRACSTERRSPARQDSSAGGAGMPPAIAGAGAGRRFQSGGIIWPTPSRGHPPDCPRPAAVRVARPLAEAAIAAHCGGHRSRPVRAGLVRRRAEQSRARPGPSAAGGFWHTLSPR